MTKSTKSLKLTIAVHDSAAKYVFNRPGHRIIGSLDPWACWRFHSRLRWPWRMQIAARAATGRSMVEVKPILVLPEYVNRPKCTR